MSLKLSTSLRLHRKLSFLTGATIFGFLAVVATLRVFSQAPPPEPVETLQEAFLVRIDETQRRSPDLNGHISRLKVEVIARELDVVIDRWFVSPKALIVRMQSTKHLTRVRKEEILEELSSLDMVELATTTSASVGQIQPEEFESSFASETEIPEPLLLGFRDFDKASHEANVQPDAPRTRGVLYVKSQDFALFGPTRRAQTLLLAAADHIRLGARVKEIHKDSGVERAELVEFDEDRTPIMEMIRRYHSLDWVEYAEPQYHMFLMDTPVNDPFANGAPGYHLDKIQARKAWDIKRDTNQIVSVIDGGLWFRLDKNNVVTGHPDIIGNNPSRPRGNVFSDLTLTNFSGSGAPDDPYDNSGAYGRPNPEGGLFSGGHGTHVAGIIGALANNSRGLAGVAWTCQILPFRVFNDVERTRPTYDTDVATSIDRSVLKGARIINMSFGGPARTQKIADAVKGDTKLNQNGQAAMIAAAGNINRCSPSPTPTRNLDSVPVYPAALEYSNLIAVANTDATDQLHCSSQFGNVTVDVAAPGTNIISTLNRNSALEGNEYNSLTGTSMSAPHVSGTLALLRETYNQSTAYELLDRIRMGVDEVPSLGGPAGGLRDFKGNVSTGGRLNTYRALLPRSKLANVSSRAKVETGPRIVINGFILRGNTTVLIRGIGPSLTSQGVSGVLQDPYLRLFDGRGIMIAENNNWKDTQRARIESTTLPPGNDLEAAIVMDLPAGGYTAQLTGVSGGQGIALTEVYELSGISDPLAPPNPSNDLKRTQNLSSRLMVRGGDQIGFLGLIVDGRGIAGTGTPAAKRRVLIRALGRSLVGPGLAETDVLSDPFLRLFDASGNVIAENNNWRDAYPTATGIYPKKIAASTLAPGFPEEAVIVATLAPGAYTVQCRGATGGQGIASIEMYEF